MFTMLVFFFFNDTATTEIYTLSLHDALPILQQVLGGDGHLAPLTAEDLLHLAGEVRVGTVGLGLVRSEEHTSELQSRQYLVCRLLLEKKKNIISITRLTTRSLLYFITTFTYY